MGPTWVLLAPGRPHVGPMNLAIYRGRLLSPVAQLNLKTYLSRQRDSNDKDKPVMQLAYLCNRNSYKSKMMSLLTHWSLGDVAEIFKINFSNWPYSIVTQISRFMGPTWGPSGADRTQVGPILAPWTLLSGNLCTCGETVLRWMPENLTDEKSTLVQGMAWHPQATSQYWAKSLSPCGVASH